MMKSSFLVMLDRDGTLIEERHYLSLPEQVQLFEGAAGALRQLQQAGAALALVTNQSGVGRGYFSSADVQAVHAHLQALLAAEQVHLSNIHFCPHSPEENCDCRKPRPDMLIQAGAAAGIPLRRSYMLGDKLADLNAAIAAGAQPILVRTGYGARTEHDAIPTSTLIFDDLVTAGEWILAREMGRDEAGS